MLNMTVINTTTMKPVATTLGSDLKIALAWAETIPFQNDFSIILHCGRDLSPYSIEELRLLHSNCWRGSTLPAYVKYQDLVIRIISLLHDRPTTSEPPPDEKRVAPLPTQEDNEMTAKKTVSKKATRKKVTKKVAVTKVERERQNDVLLPKAGSKAGQCWIIADRLAKKAGAPPKRADVVAACIKAGLNKAGSSADYQAWRKYHGLVKG